jgi:WD40 repeat protein
MKTHPIEFRSTTRFLVGSDYICYVNDNSEWVIFDENMKRSFRKINDKNYQLQISKTTHISVINKKVQLIDSPTGEVIHEVELEREMLDVHFNCNRLVFVCKVAEHEHLLSVWTTDNPLSLTHIKDVTIGDYNGSLRVDDKFIVVITSSLENIRNKTFNFISMKTFQVETSVSSSSCCFDYNNGYLFLLKNGLVRILDVASGTFLRDIRIKPPSMYLKICVNSNYVVIACSAKLHVYDLKCLKEIDAVPSHLLLTTIELECPFITWMHMNESRIVCLSHGNLHVVDLKPIGRLRCPEPYRFQL